MQVDPIKSTLIPSGAKRLKLEYDEPFSTFAFNFKLRRYHVASAQAAASETAAAAAARSAVARGRPAAHMSGRGFAGRSLHSSTFQPNLSRF